MKTNKIRMTRQREIIIQELRALKTHPTADELYDKVKKRLPRISLATIYRNLETLAALNIIQKLEVTGRQKRFDWDTSNHYHIKCIKCGRVDDIPAIQLNEIERAVTDPCGYTVLGHRLEFEGICPGCKKKGERSSSKER
ncbi:Fur family transcriptional regulator [Dissulfurimicrobium hydrothermale]|uniref:Fur family transcriptional regulator n=1 Tax=Dissulfurimicrobium hydrothermale TaxID=1750598 RepID=UPI001EDBEA19|nr:transcriptional repressor [Dissulfurimicrobium hydrothermale]UKL13887.1 transcriptional repressor [Dissulfurimicrobium hydrothermale]